MISVVSLPAKPHSAEAIVKPTPLRKTRLRPTRSPIRPAISRKLPNAIR